MESNINLGNLVEYALQHGNISPKQVIKIASLKDKKQALKYFKKRINGIK